MADNIAMTQPNAVVSVQSPGGLGVRFSNEDLAAYILGPCALESRNHAITIAMALRALGQKLSIDIVYKTSFDKANRTSAEAYRGPGLAEARDIFSEIRTEIGLPVLTDVHLPNQCAEIAEYVDILQIPAFLCRQTDLLRAAAETGCPVNVKKGQFLAPWDMRHVVDKLVQFGASDIMITERGTSFGYNTLVSDMRALPELMANGVPVIFDATHSVQQPGGLGAASGGQRAFAPILANAAAAVGVAGIFMETHNAPDTAPSDGPNMIPLTELEDVLTAVKSFDTVSKSLRVQPS